MTSSAERDDGDEKDSVLPHLDVISEGALRVKDVSPEVSPRKARDRVAGCDDGSPWELCLGWGAVARCALHVVSPAVAGDGHLFAPLAGGMVWFGSRSGGRNQADGHATGGGP